jgi:hypothetical protein
MSLAGSGSLCVQIGVEFEDEDFWLDLCLFLRLRDLS